MGYCLPQISFGNYKFTEALHFDYATFYGFVDFREAKFSKDATFYLAKFSGEDAALSNFDDATFSRGACFNGTKFSETYIIGTVFSEHADFREATFSGEAAFKLVKCYSVRN